MNGKERKRISPGYKGERGRDRGKERQEGERRKKGRERAGESEKDKKRTQKEGA